MGSTIMERLRQETAEQHERMEENRYARGIMAGSLDRAGYRRYLELFYGFIRPAEERIYPDAQLQAQGLDEGARRKAPLLERDLQALGLGADEIGRLPRCGELPDLSTPARKLGYLYVLEGSTLGGQIISRKLAASLGLEPDSGLRYFHAYGDDTRSRWLEMRSLIQQGSQGQEDETVAAARETFALLERWVEASA
ncbi:biliverdin-producing heme oxygenase [Paenibacillus albicereus]|uniref:Biliverdin-producing heme oxygenase n=1 Tax=Paenibacillus albicereus TaxID=2726185 RepID=A0A6H2H0G1_9BACL|nr:biliverdin-producing heme oxygenase [Paenibacillus albicereus]QJC53145.1 biliverdin-producing heme oxygenase [Paenibacillus albicereus]